MSFVTKKGSRWCQEELLRKLKHHYVQGVEPWEDSKYQNGKNTLNKIAKSDMKPGYPKPTGFTPEGQGGGDSA